MQQFLDIGKLKKEWLDEYINSTPEQRESKLKRQTEIENNYNKLVIERKKNIESTLLFLTLFIFGYLGIISIWKHIGKFF